MEKQTQAKTTASWSQTKKLGATYTASHSRWIPRRAEAWAIAGVLKYVKMEQADGQRR